jgi:hypothetical protein
VRAVPGLRELLGAGSIAVHGPQRGADCPRHHGGRWT